MSRSAVLLLAAILAAPVAAYLAYFLAKGLGFLDPPASREQELKRSILAALYALLVFLPVFLFGWERRWPRVWIAFGVVSGAALVFFAVSGLAAARALWILRRGSGQPVTPLRPGGNEGSLELGAPRDR
jgi:uncharacterized membrane protein YedE/YeeE